MRWFYRPAALALTAVIAAFLPAACGPDPGSGGSSAGGAGGAGGAPECTSDADCPGAAGDCFARRCFGGACGIDNEPIGAPCDEGGGKDGEHGDGV